MPAQNQTLKFAAIDFETATDNHNSACALGVVVVDGDKITEKCWLIRPPRNGYQHENITIHGIHPRDTVECRTFGELWPEIEAMLGDSMLIAHNANFDMKVLQESFGYYFPDAPPPEFDYGCTLQMARCYCHDSENGHGLAALARRFGLTLDHHNALSDARAVVELAQIIVTQEDATLPDLAERAREHADATEDERRLAAMTGRPPSEKQLNYLDSLMNRHNYPAALVQQIMTHLAQTSDMAAISQYIDLMNAGQDIVVVYTSKRHMRKAIGLRNSAVIEGRGTGSSLVITYDQGDDAEPNEANTDLGRIDTLLANTTADIGRRDTHDCGASTRAGKRCRNRVTVGTPRCASGHTIAA